MEPNMALSAACISLPLTINLSLPLPSHLKYNVSYSIMYQKLIDSSYTGKYKESVHVCTNHLFDAGTSGRLDKHKRVQTEAKQAQMTQMSTNEGKRACSRTSGSQTSKTRQWGQAPAQ